jgi:hypothetical protein
MKTDELVALLSTNLEPVDRGSVIRTLCAALAAGSIVPLGITLVGRGVRPDLMTARALIFLAMKLSFAVGIVGLALVYLPRLARPRGGGGTSSILVALPFAAVALLASVTLGLALSSHWDKMIVGDECRATRGDA